MIKKIKGAKFVLIIFLIAFIIRVAAVLVTHYALSAEMQDRIIPPDAHCSERALLILDSWRNKYEIRWIDNDHYHRYVAIIYGILGYHAMIAQLVNSLLGALAIFFIYGVAKRLFNRKVAYISIVLYAFFPSLIFWSSQNLKDAPTIFLIVTPIWLVTVLRERFQLFHLGLLILMAPLLWWLNELRNYIFIFLMYAVTLYFLINISKLNYKRNIIYALYFFLFMSFASPYGRAGILSDIPASVRIFLTRTFPEKVPLPAPIRTFLTETLPTKVFLPISIRTFFKRTIPKPRFDIYANLKDIDRRRRGGATGNTAYKFDVDISTPAKAFEYLPKGITYFLFAPFPWQARGLLQKAIVPETIIWYILFPFILYGMYVYRYKWKDTFAILLFLTITALAYSLYSSNMGTAYRHKGNLLPLFFILASAGIVHFMERKKNGNTMIN